MNETLLIVIGVAVFAATVVGVLIYFYSLFDSMAAVPDESAGAGPRPVADDGIS